MTLSDAIASEIRERALGRGHLARHVAAALDMAEISYSQRLRGQVDWRLDELEAVAEFLGYADTAELFTAANERRLAQAS